MFPDDDWILVESYNIKMFIFEVTVVLYSIKILSGSRNFYRLRMTSLTYVNECFHAGGVRITTAKDDGGKMKIIHYATSRGRVNICK
jgi:hypothetical protein